MPSDPREDPSDPLGPSGPGPGDDVWTRRERAAVARVRVLLPGLVERRVPVRLVERGPVRGVGRLRMGDGTTFLVASLDPMALGRVVRTMTAGRSVVVVRWARRTTASCSTWTRRRPVALPPGAAPGFAGAVRCG
ncbi:hypothetical protein BJF81_01555 [Ornithinimicrobium sp. CNJ-824]|uniref:hypothetical protein n=1 Tax=Ornithinimicrobium sp. CNJ-824 TaxID=1904966 RepID=UPI000961D7EF|nr:hypothetical protein [Ornithinimicrobium sp. CNJ-824]OLT22504.1 hypothetical protein BJF81_01555 [Ornithinimicrobium sp. CNJ-824]